MTSNQISHASFLDILFENRNKEYGAYELRKHYNRRLMVSVFLSIGSVFLILFFLQKQPRKENLAPVVLKNDTIKFTVFEFPPDEIINQQQSFASIRQVTQNPHLNITIVPDTDSSTVPDQETLASAAIGKFRFQGEPDDQLAKPFQVEGNLNPAGAGNASGDSGFKPEERQPSFPGGSKAWIAFLEKFLRMPDDLAPGETRKVLVRFSVGTDGSIADFEVIHSAGWSFDKEVIRVLKKMPPWIPAMQNGKTVAAFFTQPVTFKGPEF